MLASDLCDFEETSALVGTSFELPKTVFNVVEVTSHFVNVVHDQSVSIPHFLPWAHGPPVYLITQRLRV